MTNRRITVTALLVALALPAAAAAFTYESPARAISRAEAAASLVAGASAGAWADAGWLALWEGNDYDRARACFESALAKDPRLPAALEGYGRVLEVRGDYDGALRAYLAFVAAAPQHPAAYLYLYRCHILEEDTNAGDDFLRTMTDLAGRADAPPLVRAKATLYLFDRAQRRGDAAAAEGYLATLAPIREWSFVGPFDNEGTAGFDRAFPPEAGFDAAGVYDGKSRKVGWRQTPTRLPSGFLDLTSVLVPGENGVAYLAVAVNSPAARDAALIMGAGGAVKVWLNGVQVFARDSYHDGRFDQYLAPAPLAAGANYLLVKICGDDTRWGFGCRFADAAGEPLPDLTYDASPAGIAAAAAVKGRPPGALPGGGLGFFDGRIAGGDADVFDYYYAALEHAARADADDHDELPSKLITSALSLSPGVAELHYQLGAAENEESRKRLSLARAAELAPGHLQAKLEFAKYYYQLERQRDALDLLANVLAGNPYFAEAAQYQAKIYWEAGWAYDGERLAAALSERVPAYPYSKMVQAQYEQNYGDLGRAAELWRQIFDADCYSTAARDNLFTLLLDRNDLDGALAVMDRALAAEPYDLDARRKVVAALDAYGRFNDALAAADRGLTYRPEDYELWTVKGAILEKMGRLAEGRDAYRQAIAFKHNYPALENYMNYLEPAREKPRAAARLDAYDLVARYPGDAAFPRDAAVYLLNDRLVEVFDNGTSSRTVHEVIRILTPEGAENLRQMYISYTPDAEVVELKRAAVIKADGSEITATQIEEYNVFDVWSRLYYSYLNKVVTMPGLAPGDTIDFEYRVSQTGANIFADYFGDYCYFGGKNSTLRARYVLTVPAGKTYYFRKDAAVPAPTVERRGDKITYAYELTDLGPVDEEPFMPALAEILPRVQVSTFADWDEVGRWYNGLLKDVFRPSPETEALAAKLQADSPDDLTVLRRVYDFTVTQIRYVGLEFGIGGYRPHTPKQCLEALYGDCKDKATLMNTLFRLAGLKAYPVLVRTADLGELDYELPILGLFNHMISYAETRDGQVFYLDGTAEYYGFRELPEPDQGINVLVVFDDRAAFLPTPTATFQENLLATSTTFVLQPGGDANVHRRVDYGAADSPAQRERFHVPAKRKAVVEEYWNGLYPGTKVFNEQFSDVADLARPVWIEYDAIVPRLYDPAAPRISLDTAVQQSGLVEIYGKKAARRWPLVLRKNAKTVSTQTYLLPPGYRFANLPLVKEYRSPFGNFKLDVRTEGNRVTVVQDLELRAQRIAPADYPAFREFCRNVDEWETEPILVEKAP